jgi:hypothetical protein
MLDKLEKVKEKEKQEKEREHAKGVAKLFNNLI